MPTSSADSPARPPAALTAHEVVAGYGGPPIVRGASAQVGIGEVVTVVGPNGAGKSTLLKAIAGILTVETGSVLFGEVEIRNVRTDRLAGLGIGYVPQNKDIFDPLTVRENLEIGGYLLQRSKVHSRIDDVVSLMPALRRLLHRRAAKLSGGERKMVAIGRALMAEPKVLLLDEPTSGLSAELSNRLLTEDIGNLARSGTAILLVEQKALAALQISDWGYVLATGRTVISSSAKTLLARADLAEVFLGHVSDADTDDLDAGGAELESPASSETNRSKVVGR